MSEAFESSRSEPFRAPPPFVLIAPEPSLPLRHFAGAALAFVVFAAALTAGAPRLVGLGFEARFALGLAHVLTLGWVAQTILGAWTQMIPVHGQVPLSPAAAAKAAWWCLVGGAVLFVSLLWAGSDRYWLAGLLLLAAFALYLGVLGRALARSARLDWSGTHFLAAFFWLAALALLGVLMAVDRHRAVVFRDPEGGLIAHVHMALLGFVVTTIFGAGYRLFPWVALHRLVSPLEGRAALLLLQAGLAGLSLDALFLGRRLMPLWAALCAAACAVYALQFRSLLRTRPPLEPSLALVLLGLAGGALWAVLGLGLALGLFPEVVGARAAYVFAALVGCVTPVILSQVHKIAPIIVWSRVYGPGASVPAAKPPTLDELTSRRLAWLEFLGLLAAVPLGVGGLLGESAHLVRAAGAALLVCAAAYALNTAATLRHLTRGS